MSPRSLDYSLMGTATPALFPPPCPMAQDPISAPLCHQPPPTWLCSRASLQPQQPCPAQPWASLSWSHLWAQGLAWAQPIPSVVPNAQGWICPSALQLPCRCLGWDGPWLPGSALMNPVGSPLTLPVSQPTGNLQPFQCPDTSMNYFR